MENYTGYEGYERMLSEMIESFYQAYPEHKGRIAVLDMKALEQDRASELERISNELGVGNIEDSLLESEGGITSPGRYYRGLNHQEQKIGVVAGWNVHREAIRTETTNDNIGNVGVVAHELAHAIDHMKGSIFLDEAVLQENYRESYADSFRVALSALDGKNDEGIKKLISKYDNKQLTQMSDSYDNGPALTEAYYAAEDLRGELDINSANLDRHFSFWKEAEAIADEVRVNHLHRHSTGADNIHEYFYRDETRFQLSFKVDDIIKQKMEDFLPPSQRTEEYMKDVQKYLTKLSFKAHENGENSHSEEGQLFADVIYSARQEINDFLEVRQGYIPMASRVIAGHNYINERGEFADYDTPEFNPELYLGQSLKMYIEHGDNFDLNLALKSAGILIEQGSFQGVDLDGVDFQSAQGVINSIQGQSSVIDSLSNGATIDEAVALYQSEKQSQGFGFAPSLGR